jgi:hypothetical protein
LLTVCVGLPYFLLSATGPLLQGWYCLLPSGISPYRLYAISNAGSLIALVTYPFLIDPVLGAISQTILWSWLFGVFSLVCTVSAWLVFRQARAKPLLTTDREQDSLAGPDWREHTFWFVASMIPSVMLLAATNQICVDVAVVPFLWILPLTLYLLSFIVCFHSLRWCPRAGSTILWLVAVGATIPTMFLCRGVTTSLPIPVQVAVYCGLLFACCMMCHGELVRRKPDPRHLTSFYLTLAAGGASGGIFVGVIAPRVFPAYVELPVATVACTLLMVVVYYMHSSKRPDSSGPRRAWLGLAGSTLLMIAAFSALFQMTLAEVEIVDRNFYGVLKIRLQDSQSSTSPPSYQMIHGRTMHGMQYFSEQRRRWPTSYYGTNSGVGIALQHHQAGRERHIGVVGLGVGTLAAYGTVHDRLRFYEINPAVVRLAEQFFLYLHDSPASIQIVPGDARVTLHRESSRHFDILVLDAFSSDAIPIHLLTEEAFRIYLRHLKPDGILAAHISNVHVDLSPVLHGHAERMNLSTCTIDADAEEKKGVRASIWFLMATAPEALRKLPGIQPAVADNSTKKLHWTDNRSSLFEVLR